MMKKKIKSIGEFIEICMDNSFDSSIMRHRSEFVYRGLSSDGWEIQTSLYRNCGEDSAAIENSLIRNFSKYAFGEIDKVSGSSNIWRLLSIAQHYGLPTRLLDWTYSPLVALHFVTENLNLLHKDGVIYQLSLRIVKDKLPKSLLKNMSKNSSFVLTDEMMNENYCELEEFDKSLETDFICFFEPPAIDSRIINQFGLFSIANNANSNLNELVKEYDIVKIIIPKELKMELRDYLDQFNINERILFPGLDGLSKWLTRHYTPYKVIEEKKKKK
jgi:hypothetical protein